MEEPNFKVTWNFFENNNGINERYGNDAEDNDDDDDYDDRERRSQLKGYLEGCLKIITQ